MNTDDQKSDSENYACSMQYVEEPEYSKISTRETLEFLKKNDVPGGFLRPLLERIVLELDRINQRIDNL